MVGINPQTKSDGKCERCDWRFPGFHVCIDKSDPSVRDVVLSPVQKIKNEHNRYSGTQSEETRVRKRDAAKRYWESRHAKNEERNKEIITLYRDETWSTRELAAHFTLDQRTVLSVLHKAEDQGILTIRSAKRRKSLRFNPVNQSSS